VEKALRGLFPLRRSVGMPRIPTTDRIASCDDSFPVEKALRAILFGTAQAAPWRHVFRLSGS